MHILEGRESRGVKWRRWRKEEQRGGGPERKMKQIGTKWTKLKQHGGTWRKVEERGGRWRKVEENGKKWSEVE